MFAMVFFNFSLLLLILSGYIFYEIGNATESFGYFIACLVSFASFLVESASRKKDELIEAQERHIEIMKKMICEYEKENERLRGIGK